MRALAVTIAFALTACAAQARQVTTAEALAPLIGCWRGTFDNTPDVYDERCFQQLGAHIVDIHYVRPTSYSGETTYHDDGAGGIVFAYAASDGGRSNGALIADGARYVVQPHTHRGGGGAEYRLRSTWTLEAPGRLVMVTEQQVDAAWQPFMRITYTRSSPQD